MEDPAYEIPILLKRLTTRPTMESLAQTVKHYFTEDCEFYHPYVNVDRSMGLDSYLCIFQYALFFVNYQDVLVRDIVYEEKKNIAVVRFTVRTNPWVLLWRRVDLQFLTQLEFEDRKDELTGKVLKKVKVQRDYFIRSPLLQAVPIIGDLYDSDTVRFWLGETTAGFAQAVGQGYRLFFPTKIREVVFAFWRNLLQVPPNEWVQAVDDHEKDRFRSSSGPSKLIERRSRVPESLRQG